MSVPVPFIRLIQKDVYLKAIINENYWESGKPYVISIEYKFIAMN
jgi:hypothetical protein